jgi:tRNA(Met) C34 N-acetyltransferase TmcA
MSACPNCAAVLPIEDAGAVVLQTERKELTEKLVSFLTQQHIAYDVASDMYLLPYETKDALLSMLQGIRERFADAEKDLLKFGVQTNARSPFHQPSL